MSVSGRQETILVPLDFSKSSLVAMSLGVEISRRLMAQLLLVHVFRYRPQHKYAVPVEWMVNELRRRAKGQLNLLRGRASRAGVPAETLLLETTGDPAVEILRTAEKQLGPILVLGTHSRTGLDRFLIGSTAEEVLRSSECPVITVSPQVTPYWHRHIQNILLATDLTERSLAPLTFIRALWSPESRLVVLHVASPDSPIIDSSWEHPIRERLNSLFGEIEVRTKVEFRHVVHAEISRAIHEATAGLKTDLIAMGIHPAKALTSHSQPRTGFQIIMSAPCAVLSVCE